MHVRPSAICVVLVNYYGEQDTRECLRSLLAARQGSELKIIVVHAYDSHKKNESEVQQTSLSKEFPNCTHISCLNKGFAANTNVGLRKAFDLADVSMSVVLNNDTTVGSDFVESVVQAVRDGITEKTVFSPKIYFTAGKEFHSKSYTGADRGKVIWYAGGVIDWNNVYCSHVGVDEVDRGQLDEQRTTAFATGCCMFISRWVYEHVGAFDETYFMYFEDVEYSLRVKKLGGTVEYVPKIQVWHNNAGTSGSGSALHVYYQTRNRIRFSWKFTSFHSTLAVVKESLGKLLSGSVTEKKAVLHALLGKTGK